MIIQAISFYIFAIILVLSGVAVITARNPVHSVLFLILAFFNAAALFVLLGAEFLAMILVIVYVGAVAVLFLFVVMMLDVNFVELRKGFQQYLLVGALVGLVLFFELVRFFGTCIVPRAGGNLAPLGAATPEHLGNTAALGALIYTRYLYAFQAAGLILLVAMIGAIVLTHRVRDVRRQLVSAQVWRGREDAIAVVMVRSREGV